MGYDKYVKKIKNMIDRLKAMSAELGLSNTGDEYKIISELFSYKFLNDKLLYDYEKREDENESFDDFVDFADDETPRMREEHLIDNLFNQQNEPDFHEIFDRAFEEVSELNKDIYSIKTTGGSKKPIFEPLAVYIRDEDKELDLAKRAINILAEEDFGDIYESGFDYFSAVFEYLIKDYNKDSGKYAEFFTPVDAGLIMANILFDDTPVSNVSVYDPSAGSGTLLLCMANQIGTNNCQIYSQDISQKSTQFLRINLMLNKMAHSLHNVIEGNTMTIPSHKQKGNAEKLKQFDFIVSNPPFKLDFSKQVEDMKKDPYNRFFDGKGIPKIPNKDIDKMPIYLCFIQHIMASLSDKGKAAIVVPAGFVSAASGIPKMLREELIKNNWLTGVIHMPPHIFANTGTSVSILFLDRAKTDDKVMMMDASKLGSKVSLDDGQRTLFDVSEKEKIINFFKGRVEEAEFSVLVDKSDIEGNGFGFQTGHYVEIIDEKIAVDIDGELSIVKSALMKELERNQTLNHKVINILKEV